MDRLAFGLCGWCWCGFLGSGRTTTRLCVSIRIGRVTNRKLCFSSHVLFSLILSRRIFFSHFFLLLLHFSTSFVLSLLFSSSLFSSLPLFYFYSALKILILLVLLVCFYGMLEPCLWRKTRKWVAHLHLHPNVQSFLSFFEKEVNYSEEVSFLLYSWETSNVGESTAKEEEEEKAAVASELKKLHQSGFFSTEVLSAISIAQISEVK